MDVKQTIENVQAISGGTPTLGVLKLTNYHIIFSVPPLPVSGDPSGSNPPARSRESFVSFPIISLCTFRPTPPSSGIPSSIRLRCRDFSYVTFNIPDDRSAREAFDFIRSRTCRLGKIENLYAFHYEPVRPERGLDGWNLYDAREEFRRQGISAKAKDLGWRISTINQDYAFSPTYPAVLAVPSSISDNVLKYAANHRSRARVPALTYLHPVNSCVITRSSQPCVGLRGNRSIQDERLVGACFSAAVPDQGSGTSESSPAASQSDLPPGGLPEPGPTESDRQEDAAVLGNPLEFDEKTGKRVLYGATRQNLIVDARPALNSYAMQAIGLGSENMEYYKFAKKVFLNIDNIHVMRDSLAKVVDAVKDADVSPFPPNRELLAKSGWLRHIGGILEGSHLIAKQVGIYHSNVLIHCSDGWDRTSQLSALSQIMLDPYYRTIDGFIVLVEKDWLSFGHMFQQRSGFLNHEKWFVVQNDAMAGTRIEPGDSDGRDGRNEALENAMASAKRFFKKNLSQEKDDSDGETGDDYTLRGAANVPVVENEATRPREISPVFHQFLDATYQLVRQNPTRFEFNERFLRRLLYHLYSCQYGTFLYNNERQRHEATVQSRTTSVWNYFLSRRQDFTNSSFDSVVDDNIRGQERLLFPRQGEVRWWHQLYSRRDEEMNGHFSEAADVAERVMAYNSASSAAASPRAGSGTQSTPQPPDSPRVQQQEEQQHKQQPPGLPTSKSVLVGVETATAHSALTPEPRTATLTRSSSVGDVGSSSGPDSGPSSALTALQESIANVNIGQSVRGVLGGLTSSPGADGGSSHRRSGHGAGNEGGAAPSAIRLGSSSRAGGDSTKGDLSEQEMVDIVSS